MKETKIAVMNKVRKYETKIKKEVDREKRKQREEDRINKYIFDKFREEYIGVMVLVGFVLIMIEVWFITSTNVFQDGVIRFFLGTLVFIVLIGSLRNHFVNKIRKREGLK